MTLVSVDRLVNLNTDLKKGVHSSIFLGRISFHKIVALFTARLTFLCDSLLSYLLPQPERIQGDEYSIRSELWSLGVSLLEVKKTSKVF